MKILIAVFFFSFCFITLSAQKIISPSLKEKLNHLDSYLAKALDDWETPGMAVGIVYGDSLIFAKGYGVRNINKKNKVDCKTLFPIASITKTFTATSIATLIDSKKMTWDDSVANYLPWFKLYDSYVTKNFKIRDMLSHRSGLKTFSGDLLWYGSNYSRKEIIKRAQYLKPKFGFREKFGYSNIMFIVAGEIIKKITNKSWDEYINQSFFKKLGMISSNTSIKQLVKEKNIAIPHTEKDGKTIAIEFLNWDNIGGAGAINSNIEDMSKWISLHLNKGMFNKEQYLSEARYYEMWAQHTVNHITPGYSKIWPSTHFKSYGLGWSLFDYKGFKIVGHDGGYDGVLSSMMLIPQKNLGFIILTNKNSKLYFISAYKILDVLLSEDYRQETDWSKLFLPSKNQKKASNSLVKGKKTIPIKQIQAIIGTYKSKLYGNAVVEKKDSVVHIQLIPSPKFNAILTFIKDYTFEIEFNEFPSLPKGTVTFINSKKGMQMLIDVPNPDFDFSELDFFKEK